MSRRRALAAVAAVAVAGAAGAFVRETTARGDPAGGTCLWWSRRQVAYQVNAASAATPPLGSACADCAPCLDAGAAAAAVDGALAAWGGATRAGAPQACTDLALQPGVATTRVATGNDGVNLVVFRRGWCGATAVVPQNDPCRGALGACAAKYNCWEHDPSGTLGLTTLTYDTSTGEILDADVEFHGRDWSAQPTGALLTCAASPACSGSPYGPPPESGCTSVDVASLALHEAGHLLGLDHTCQYAPPYASCPLDSVMQPTIPVGAVRRTLTADDVEGVCAIYPRGAATAKCPPLAAPPSGGCGCGGASGGGLLALLGLGLALRRRRR